MPVPLPRCVQCDALITDWDPSRGQHPKFCTPEPGTPEEETCRSKYQLKPICGRCHKPFAMKMHSAVRFHEECALGCKVCGQPLQDRKSGTANKRTHRFQHIYCSEKCQDHAWAGQAMPVCRYCEKPTALPRSPKALRNPPKAHLECLPNKRRNLAEEAEERRRQEIAQKVAAQKATKATNKQTTPKRESPFE